MGPTDHFEQQNIGNCYFLAALKAILDNPFCKFLLGKIKLEKRKMAAFFLPNRNPVSLYRYTFPNGDAVEIDTNRIGVPENGHNPVKAPKQIQALELAMAERWRKARNDARLLQHDSSKPAYPWNGQGHALELMCSGKANEAVQQLVGGEIIPALYATDSSKAQDYDALSAASKTTNKLRRFLEALAADRDHIYILIANTPNPGTTEDTRKAMELVHPQYPAPIHISRKHSCAISAFDTKAKTITVVDPHDTIYKKYLLDYAQFCKLFGSILGVKVEKPMPEFPSKKSKGGLKLT